MKDAHTTDGPVEPRARPGRAARVKLRSPREYRVTYKFIEDDHPEGRQRFLRVLADLLLTAQH